MTAPTRTAIDLSYQSCAFVLTSIVRIGQEYSSLWHAGDRVARLTRRLSRIHVPGMYQIAVSQPFFRSLPAQSTTPPPGE